MAHAARQHSLFMGVYGSLKGNSAIRYRSHHYIQSTVNVSYHPLEAELRRDTLDTHESYINQTYSCPSKTKAYPGEHGVSPGSVQHLYRRLREVYVYGLLLALWQSRSKMIDGVEYEYKLSM